jgi:hypothetical protein
MVWLLLLATHAPKARRAESQAVTAQVLTAICAAFVAGELGLLAISRGDRAGPAEAALWAGAFALAAAPFAMVVLATQRAPIVWRTVAGVLGLALTVPLAVRFDAGSWSLPGFAATLCAWSAALALAWRDPSRHAHRHPG